MRRLAPLLGLLLLVAGGVLLLTRGDPAHDPGSTVARGGADGATLPARLEGRPTGEAPAAANAQAEPPADAPQETIRVELSGRVVIDRADAAVSVSAFGPTTFIGNSEEGEVAHAERRGPGALRVDVTDIVRQIRNQGYRPEIRLRLTSHGYVGAPVTLALPPPEDLLAGRAHIEPVTLVLRPGAGLSGRVVGIDGRPIPGASVALFLMTPDGPEAEAVTDWVSDEEGRFALATARAGRHLLVASWFDYEGMTDVTTERPLPASVVVDLEVGAEVEGIELRLRSSFAIRGTVRVEGGTAAEATIGWRLVREGSPLRRRDDSHFGWGPSLRYADGEVHWARYRVQADEEGRFVILGASAVPHRIFIDDVVGAHLHRMSKEKADVEVTPPVQDAVLALELARLVLVLRLDGQPAVLEETVRLSDLGMHPDLPDDVCWGTSFHEPDGEGRIQVGLTPGHRYAVFVQEPGLKTWAQPLEAPAAGETLTLTVDLERERPKPRLVAVFEGEGAEELTLATFGFYETEVDPMSRTPWPIRAATSTEGRFVIEDLVPGRHRVHVRPGRGWYDVPNDWLEAVVEVEIPQTGEAEFTVALVRGGRLLIEATDVDGRHLECPCTIRGPDGDALETNFIVSSQDTGVVISGGLPGMGPAWVDRTLPPGTYEVTLEPEGYAREVRTVEIRVGAPTTLRVTLRRP